MKEIRFSTQRQYELGSYQVITARVHDDGTVIFKDHQRNVYGVIKEAYEPDCGMSFQDFVMFWYDAGYYDWDARAKDLK